jgi:superfamily II DNA or RNA helicase
MRCKLTVLKENCALRRDLRSHQVEAYAAATALLAEEDRANVVMACGSGKTLVGMRIAETANRLLMLEPSLALIRQALEEARQDGLLDGRDVICVCSDKTLASEDHWKVTDEELGLPVTTDSVTLRNLLQNSGDKCIVFCTYQSQPLLRDSLPDGFEFDFGNFDEAHRTAGVRERTFSVALSDEQIPIAKRLFLTATPRLFAERDDGQEDTAYSMDDEQTYGPRAYELPLAKAIERGIVCDYQVLTACVSGADVQDAIGRASHLLLPQKKLPVELVAGQIAVVRAIQSTGARRVITFHTTIDDAAAFSRDRLKIYKRASVAAFHIHGDMPGRQRQAVIRAFLSVDGPSVLTNCHCLTEGVDVPEIDMVGIMCRKESVQELVQALGRALRNRPGKERGYVMLPLYVNEHEPMESAIDRSDMGVTWEILHSVLESDGALTDKLLQPRAHSYPEDGAHAAHHHRGHLRVVAPDALLEDLQRAISVRHIHRLAARWDVMVTTAARYAARTGQLDVPVEHLEDDLPLGRWIEIQRDLRKRGRLSTARIDELTALGIHWNSREAKWAAGLKLARDFKSLHGHLNVPPSDAALRTWIKTTRLQAARGSLPALKSEALRELDIELPVRRSVEDKLKALEEWRAAHPEGRPKKKGPDRAQAFFLAATIARFRTGKLDEATIGRLARIGFDVRSVPTKRPTGHQRFGEQSWDLHYQALKAYIAAHDWHGLWRTREFNGLSIQSWVNYQRSQKRNGTLTPERVSALDALGIHWNRKADWWIGWVEQLETHYREHGHLRLPKTRAFATLQNKVTLFRRRLEHGTLPAELAGKLAAINFPRTVDEEYWQWAIHSLQAWRNQHGVNALLRADLPAILRHFLNNKKRVHRREQLPDENLKQLRDLGVPWAALDSVHTQMMARLTRLARELGKPNVEVMANREADLAEWLETQLEAASRGDLSHEVVKGLRKVGIEVSEQALDAENLLERERSAMSDNLKSAGADG